ncbi:HDIG domain-containing protein [Desemzia sp. RIT804]|uniref:HD family phosphohydrolase n=1 Tax=Desemzia sp. RIT 804 TaxID=2810209 RepID=UPI0019507850|nr:HDIG domain-containing metalloprotein [Desemzia sp. RIT 804]MBM6613872.1 HDIG domain-containing protein [Desemzia sp. RIT 804]
MMRAFTALRKKVEKFFVPLIMLLFSSALFLLMYSGIKPAILDIQLYQVAETTIRANATVEDTAQTEANQKVAEDNVAPVYSFNSETQKVQLSKVQILFVTIEEVQKEANKIYSEKVESSQPAIPENTNEGSESLATPTTVEPLTEEEKYGLFQNKAKSLEQETQEFISELPQWAITALLEAPAGTLTTLNEALTTIISEKMAQSIRLEELKEAIEDAQDSIQYVELENTYQRVANLILEHAIIENNIFNEQATEQARQEALRNVQPVMILQGQVIVQEGHVVDSTDMHQLELLGMLDDEPSYHMIYSLIILLIAQLVGVYLISKIESLTSQEFSKILVLYSLIVIVSVAIMKGLQLLQLAGIDNIAFLYPAALASMLANAFLTPKFGYLLNTFLPAFSIFIYTGYRGTTNALVIVVIYALSGLFGALMRQRKEQKIPGKLLWLMIVGNGIVMLSMIFYLNQPILTFQTLSMVTYSVFSGVLAYALATILIPYIDVYYADNAVLTLTELSNPNQPLLKLLLTKSPGTYHHSLMVANLSSNAVSAIGGDSLFARVACYYHDVGKLTHPLFFVENLPSGMDNPHNLLSPYESKEIIFGHVSEGVRMLKEAKLPQSIIDVCAQHHGTTLMKYFYAQAKKENSEAKESDFRYPGPKPQTKEAAVINIADSAEAACRSMSKPTKQSIEEFVHELIVSRIKDGQFDECDITMKELRIVEAALVDNLVGTFHSRIEYPKTEPTK